MTCAEQLLLGLRNHSSQRLNHVTFLVLSGWLTQIPYTLKVKQQVLSRHVARVCLRSSKLITLTFLNMLKYFIVACLMLGLVAPAEAHRRHRGHRHKTVVVTPWLTFWQPQPRVRINKNCVYKPWNNKTICRY